MSEDELLRCVMECARLFRWRTYHIRNSRAGIVQGDVGFPDIVAIRDGSLLVAELKSDKGKLTQAQIDWLVDWAYAGARTYVWRPHDWLCGAIEEVLR